LRFSSIFLSQYVRRRLGDARYYFLSEVKLNMALSEVGLDLDLIWTPFKESKSIES
jgi:hypothetical protein